MTRILYECRDFDRPSGGVRRLYRHVEILRAAGIDASILHHTAPFLVTWFEHSAPILYMEDGLALTAEDVLVIPEGHTDVIMSTADAPYTRVVIALNWANIYRTLPAGRDWRDFGISQVIAGSDYEREFIRRAMGLDSVVLASGTDLDLFRPRQPKRLQVAYMPRKNPEAFHVIAGIFRSLSPRWRHVPFVAIDAVAHADVARVMTESAIFLSTGFPEGLARPPIEAMASGCLVVGFAGRGALEYMLHGKNCLRADDLDMLTAAEYLDLALQYIEGGEAQPLVAAARKTAERYSLAREEQAVLGYWQPRLERRRHALAV